jgi:pSer/pThr/pTyr-binding forkhead associated (FHA) protein
MPIVTLKFKNDPIAIFHLEKERSLKIGRSNDNDVIINNLAVSGYHAKIDSVGDAFVFVDLQSKNGSFVNEKLVSSHWLQDGDVISIGKHLLVFTYTDEESQPVDQTSKMDKTMAMDTSHYRSLVEKSMPKKTPRSMPKETPRPVKQAKPEKRKWGFLTYLAGGQGHIRLRSKLTKIGKDLSSDIIIKGLTIGKTVATISRTQDSYVFSYVGGLTKPRVNDQKITEEPVILKEADIIDIGTTKLQFGIKMVTIKPH